MNEEKAEFFSILAEVKDSVKKLVLTDLTFGRLMDDIVVPFEKKEPFFIDGVPVNKDRISRLQILRETEHFKPLFHDMHHKLRRGDDKIQKIYGEQYYTRLEAVLREGCEDVTSQIIKAFDVKIRPSLSSYLPKREELIKAASVFFWEGVKKLGGI
jgi:hypothetical protein